MTPKSRSILELHLATLMLGMTALFAKFISLPAYTLICIRSLMTAAVLAMFIRFMNEPLRIQTKTDTLMIVLTGAILCIHWVTYFYVLQTIPIAIAVITLFTFPVITSLIEPFFFNEAWDKREIITSAMIVVGISLIMPDFSIDNHVTVGVLIGLFSALLFALRNILSRKYTKRYSGSLLMFYQTLVTGLLILPFVFQQVPGIESENWGKLVLLAVIFTAIPHTVLTRSMSHIKASTAGIVMSLQPLYATLYAIWLLDEIPSIHTWFGGTLVAGAVILETMKQRAATS